jgi:hypothetical protein
MKNSGLLPTTVDAASIPDGFTAADPKGSHSQSEADIEAQQRQAEKEAILQQALTSDALERLRRIKVRHYLASASPYS